MTRSGIASTLGLIALVVVSMLLLGHQGVQWFSPSGERTAYIKLTDANGLQPGSRVLDRGVEVGKVRGLTVDADRVEVEVRYAKDTRITNGAKVRVQNLSGLGETYLTIAQGDGAAIPDGARLEGVVDTADATVGALSSSLSRLMKQLDPGTVQRLLARADQALPDREQTVPTIDAGAVLSATSILRQLPDIKDLLQSFNSITPRATDVGALLLSLDRPLRTFGKGYGEMAPFSVSYISKGDYPNVIKDGMLELFKVIQGFEDGAAPSVQYLSELLLPSVRAMAEPLSTINGGQLLDTALASVRGRSGAVTLRLAAPSDSSAASPSSTKPAPGAAPSSAKPAAASGSTAPSSTPAQPR
ncbi:MCE family protein [Tsukamurella sputi]|uniref:MCE family protein n=1 Tax=Tsukamurella sputi TaxID=2591848 RepID=A0A5C5RQ43_9ACTN|nr:MlaD family protein [Tsukamurella sputi]TWS24261.1 MCE family protein [Tsukamurella sputi]